MCCRRGPERPSRLCYRVLTFFISAPFVAWDEVQELEKAYFTGTTKDGLAKSYFRRLELNQPAERDRRAAQDFSANVKEYVAGIHGQARGGDFTRDADTAAKEANARALSDEAVLTNMESCPDGLKGLIEIMGITVEETAQTISSPMSLPRRRQSTPTAAVTVPISFDRNTAVVSDLHEHVGRRTRSMTKARVQIEERRGRGRRWRSRVTDSTIPIFHHMISMRHQCTACARGVPGDCSHWKRLTNLAIIRLIRSISWQIDQINQKLM